MEGATRLTASCIERLDRDQSRSPWMQRNTEEGVNNLRGLGLSDEKQIGTLVRPTDEPEMSFNSFHAPLDQLCFVPGALIQSKTKNAAVTNAAIM